MAGCFISAHLLTVTVLTRYYVQIVLWANGDLEGIPRSHLIQCLLIIFERKDIGDHPVRPDLFGVKQFYGSREAEYLGERADDAVLSAKAHFRVLEATHLISFKKILVGLHVTLAESAYTPYTSSVPPRPT